MIPKLSVAAETMLNQDRLSRLPRTCEVIADVVCLLAVRVDNIGSAFGIAMQRHFERLRMDCEIADATTKASQGTAYYYDPALLLNAIVTLSAKSRIVSSEVHC